VLRRKHSCRAARDFPDIANLFRHPLTALVLALQREHPSQLSAGTRQHPPNLSQVPVPLLSGSGAAMKTATPLAPASKPKTVNASTLRNVRKRRWVGPMYPNSGCRSQTGRTEIFSAAQPDSYSSTRVRRRSVRLVTERKNSRVAHRDISLPPIPSPLRVQRKNRRQEGTDVKDQSRVIDQATHTPR
jgi:hypothetical protein